MPLDCDWLWHLNGLLRCSICPGESVSEQRQCPIQFAVGARSTAAGAGKARQGAAVGHDVSVCTFERNHFGLLGAHRWRAGAADGREIAFADTGSESDG